MTIRSTALAAALATLPLAAHASVEVGTLTCQQTDRTNLVVFSEATFNCDFQPLEGETEQFTAKANKIGLDLSTKTVERMVWAVFAPSSDTSVGALEGNFYGATADASLGQGAGAHVLIGGGDKSITLQPVAVTGIEGLGFTAAIEEFRLDMVDGQ